MTARLSELGDLQLAVLNVLWTRQAATVHEVRAALPSERKPAYTTVLTVLRNLEKRGLVAHEALEGARMFRYRPLVTAQDTRAGVLRDLIDSLFGGSPAQLVACLLETQPLSPTELRALHAAIEARVCAFSEQNASS